MDIAVGLEPTDSAWSGSPIWGEFGLKNHKNYSVGDLRIKKYKHKIKITIWAAFTYYKTQKNKNVVRDIFHISIDQSLAVKSPQKRIMR